MNFTTNLVYQIKNLQLIFNNPVCVTTKHEKSDWKVFLGVLEDVIYTITYIWLLFTFVDILYNNTWNCSKYLTQKVKNYYNLNKEIIEGQIEQPEPLLQQQIAQDPMQEVKPRNEEEIQTKNISECQLIEKNRWKDFKQLQRNRNVTFRQHTEQKELNEVAQDEVVKSQQQPHEQQAMPTERKSKRYSSTWKTKPRTVREIGTFIT